MKDEHPMQHAADPNLYGISPYRTRSGSPQVGWKLNIRRRGVAYQRAFHGKDHGGLDGALQAALALRDEIDRNCPPLSKREWCATLRTTNTSGVPGVYRGKGYWKAQLSRAGRTLSRRFSIAIYGEDEAFRLAVEARRTMLAQMEGALARWPEADARAAKVAANVEAVVIPPLGPHVAPNPVGTPKTSDVPGVCLGHSKSARKAPDGSAIVQVYWMAIFKLAGRYLCKNFSVARYGFEEAKRMAIAQRHQWEAQHARGEPLTTARLSGRSGIHGVRKVDGANPRWQARLRYPDGRIVTRVFSVKIHGDDEARRLAIAARQAFEAEYPQMAVHVLGTRKRLGSQRTPDVAPELQPLITAGEQGSPMPPSVA